MKTLGEKLTAKTKLEKKMWKYQVALKQEHDVEKVLHLTVAILNLDEEIKVIETEIDKHTITDEEEDVFTYLDDLRASGVVNMYGAASYVQAQYDMNINIARKHLNRWMETFDVRHEGGN